MAYEFLLVPGAEPSPAGVPMADIAERVREARVSSQEDLAVHVGPSALCPLTRGNAVERALRRPTRSCDAISRPILPTL